MDNGGKRIMKENLDCKVRQILMLHWLWNCILPLDSWVTLLFCYLSERQNTQCIVPVIGSIGGY